jgi:hypothetical protein
MDPLPAFDDLYGHLERTTRLRREEVVRVVADVFEYFSESEEQFVRRRHAELQCESRRNDEIFRLIAAELSGRRFTAPPLTERQIRRLVYG